jgi:hypothetical protein
MARQPRARYCEKVAEISLTIRSKLTHLAERPVLILGRNLGRKYPAGGAGQAAFGGSCSLIAVCAEPPGERAIQSKRTESKTT